MTPLVQALCLPLVHIYGANDIWCPARITCILHRLNPRMVDLEMPDVGHFPFLTAPGRHRIFALLRRLFLPT